MFDHSFHQNSSSSSSGSSNNGNGNGNGSVRPTRRSLDLTHLSDHARQSYVQMLGDAPLSPGRTHRAPAVASNHLPPIHPNSLLHQPVPTNPPISPPPNHSPNNSSNLPPRPRERFKSFSWTVGESNTDARVSELSMVASRSKNLKNEFSILYDVLKSSEALQFHTKVSSGLRPGTGSGLTHCSKYKTLLIQNQNSPDRHILTNTLMRRGHTVVNSPCDVTLIHHLHNQDPFSLFIYNQRSSASDDSVIPVDIHTAAPNGIAGEHSVDTNMFTFQPASNSSSDGMPQFSRSCGIDHPTQITGYNDVHINGASAMGGGGSTPPSYVNSLEFIRTLREIVGPYCVIIVVTASDNPIEFSSIIDAGANDYIPHPLSSVLLDVRLNCAERMVNDHQCLTKADELYDSAKRIVSCIEYSSDGMEIWSSTGQIKYLNYSISTSVGYSRWELLNKEFSFLIDNQEIIPQMWATITGGKTWNGFIRTKHSNGTTIYFETNISPVHDQSQKLLYYNCSKRDVTQKRIDEESRTAEHEKTLQKSRLRLSMMSHDIRTPMNGIIGMTDLLSETTMDSQQKHYLDIIKGSSNTLLNIINDLLDISKIEAGKLEIDNIEFDFRETLEDVCELMGERAQTKALNLMAFVHPSVPQKLIGDSSRLKQIFTNLLGNSVKFTDNGEIIVVCNMVSFTDENITLRIEVKDTGIGIKKEALPLLFKAFTQAEGSIARQYAGSGLGLAICKELAQLAFNGDIGVDSQYGVGSTFWTVLTFKSLRSASSTTILPMLTLQMLGSDRSEPMIIQSIDQGVGVSGDATAMLVDYTVSSENPPNFRGSRMLLIERNMNQCKFLTQQFSVWNIILDSTDDITKAIQMWDQSVAASIPYSMIIMDLSSVGTDAFFLAQKFTGHAKSIGVVLPLLLLLPLKMRSPSLEEEARRSGIGEIVTKPIRMSNLLDSLISLTGLRQRKERTMNSPAVQVIHSPHDSLVIRVLVVDDNTVNQQVAHRMLQSIGCVVDMVSSGLEALECLDATPYDMVFLDIMMPDMDGFQVAKEIREREIMHKTKRIPIIAMTANAFKEDQLKCLNSGMDDYLSKPIKFNEFRSLMSKWKQNIFHMNNSSNNDTNTGSVPPTNTINSNNNIITTTSSNSSSGGVIELV
ncbi:hypothetical protein SAMD00019534_003560 [Acytostelium subglobosum LB1]|uniref:hypothetical protein n=1 Tax=Acytostelium subglobosum LB1 TaxID=1410327 RepID=UPI000644C1A6|nr:hypothetical protein SAMD00019534_003560 [Acytostelium subglobosum LB1]GAM17181.1 hypothetical protein SAMD00019534_003560 [Acytostelium subglobosum LB1]|eukprot:XP_012759243.1 hypothetical protein SAMD00019534_003560 [Acytostelium subglobosum LB1]